MSALQELLDRSAAGAGAALRQNFCHPDWVMSAEEFLDFWKERRMASVATLAARDGIHAAPLEVSFDGARFHVPSFANSSRLRDLRRDSRCAITSWENAWTAVIAYGRADDTALAAGAVVVVPGRLFAMRPPAWHHSRTR